MFKKEYCRDYSYEKMRTSRFRTRKYWYERHGIDITYLSPAWGVRSNISHYILCDAGRLGCNIEYNNGTVIKKTRYSSKTKDNYFFYRLYEMEKLDHGITGADEFFSQMVVNYVKEYRMLAMGNTFRESIYEFHSEHGLRFCSEQIKIFAYIADCIASHNIYMANDDKKYREEYMKYSLNCLLSEKFEPISYKENPLLFILCVADTIEPSKRFTSLPNRDVLNSISMDYSMDENTLHVEIDEVLYNSEAGRQYVADIKGLDKWCDINTSVVIRYK